MLFALHTPYSTFCKDDPMMVNWPKDDVKGVKNKDTMLCLKPETICFLLV